MFNFFRRKQREKATIALDIGSEVVKATLFTVEKKHNVGGEVTGKRAIVKGFHKIRQKLGNVQNGIVTDIASVVNNCKKAINITCKQSNLTPTQLVMGIAGESVRGFSVTVVHKRKKQNTKIDLSELQNIIHKLQWRAFREIRKQVSEESGHPEIDLKLVNATIVDIRIDNYRVTNPLGFQGKEVQMSIFNSFAPLAHFSALQSIADDLNLQLICTTSEPFALSHSISQEDENFSAIFIDVGGNTTDIAVVEQGNVIGTKMFGVGGRTFTKRLAIELNISFKEAEELKKSYSADKLEQKSNQIISDIIKTDLETWLDGITITLSEFNQLDALPSKILLCGGGSYLPEIKDILNNKKWYKKLHFSSTPQATFIHLNDLNNVIDETRKVNNRQNIIPMALVSMGIELIGEETVIQKELRKAIGIMKV